MKEREWHLEWSARKGLSVPHRNPREMPNHIHHDEKFDMIRPSVDGWQEGRLHCEVWQSVAQVVGSAPSPRCGLSVNEVVPANSTTFKDFNPDNERLDTFLAVDLKCTQYEKLWMVTKKLLILSHVQATVEHGFSINSHVAVKNLKEESLVAQRIVHNAITTAGGAQQR